MFQRLFKAAVLADRAEIRISVCDSCPVKTEKGTSGMQSSKHLRLLTGDILLIPTC